MAPQCRLITAFQQPSHKSVPTANPSLLPPSIGGWVMGMVLELSPNNHCLVRQGVALELFLESLVEQACDSKSVDAPFIPSSPNQLGDG